ncbi:unnamed protein product [Didymodactylos carnosus]|uniref:Calcineurin-like phosphoesterase domain-containing protein n=1 Tax=Didymodactylos carnosus TaxID=1234261 RepID=A0A815E4N6_9BILA|nr:unnamed protein product [Didymodactylos carnosus]CAF4128147.1 unnamed protein product [Didymodactylos carnosus]
MHRHPHHSGLIDQMNKFQQQQPSNKTARASSDAVSSRRKTQFRLIPTLKAFIHTRYGLITIVGLLVVLYNEIFTYEYARFYWPNIEHLKNSNVEKLLLVADPQLIGEKHEGLFGLITRRDADRYLSKTFTQARTYLMPDWIIFLGDIFDEGLSATDNEYKRYYSRFQNIFQYNDIQQKSIVIPGDNDVGGEYFGDKKPHLKERFKSYFGRTIGLYKQNDIEFLKLDIDMYESYFDGKRRTILEQMQHHSMTSKFRIILNHWPLVSRSVRFVKPFIEELDPNLILKANHMAHLTILWTPQRYLALYTYAAYGIFVVSVLLLATINTRRTVLSGLH